MEFLLAKIGEPYLAAVAPYSEVYATICDLTTQGGVAYSGSGKNGKTAPACPPLNLSLTDSARVRLDPRKNLS